MSVVTVNVRGTKFNANGAGEMELDLNDVVEAFDLGFLNNEDVAVDLKNGDTLLMAGGEWERVNRKR